MNNLRRNGGFCAGLQRKLNQNGGFCTKLEGSYKGKYIHLHN